MISANYFDGTNARLHAVDLSVGVRGIMLSNAALLKTYPMADITLAEPFSNAPCVLDFADGARCEVPGSAARQVLHAALGYQPSRVVRLQDRWIGALLALVALIAFALAAFEWGIPVVAEKLVQYVPETMDASLGSKALVELEGGELKPSRLSPQRVAEVQRIFEDMKPAVSRQPLRLLVRAVPRIGPNAFALPNGTIVMTDAMVLLALNKKQDMTDEARDKLAGVLAHEIGHVQGRHSMRAMARSSLTLAFSATLFGDFSAVVAGAPTVVLRLEHSREMEAEADNYAIALLKDKGVSTLPLAQLFEDVVAHHANGGDKVPRWLRLTLSYASTHPKTADRIKLLRDAAAAPKPAAAQ